ncbi:mechanosensitive ion channel family protein [Euhalothece natronophila Z-M001]|uniref:Mechanosensitive ion channel family protein n=1 Tax=Euhalothece natronophila Z-M001 TaxID=522448 RepID=A0A5B8NPG1_9CHRO|nr:mechanosensitive ion channel family protein [Euhalothece natronophila]QDZ41213.1 mechanosensitive ion channel family protein [Euhalothece natronophila Z-M001]
MTKLSGYFYLFAEQGEELSEELITEITLEKILYAISAIALSYLLLVSIQFLTTWSSEKVPRRYRLLIKQSVPFWKGLVLIITISYLINLFLNLSGQNLLALTGTIALTLGFAFKDYTTSIIAGVVALFEAPYHVGDRVKIDEHYGEVTDFGLRGIRLKTPDDDLITIPHSKIFSEAISNSNSGKLEAQVVTNFYFHHEEDTEAIIEILYQAAYSSKYTQLKLPIVVIVSEKSWGTHFKLRAYPMDARDEFIYQTDLTRRSKKAFKQMGLKYPNLTSKFELTDAD